MNFSEFAGAVKDLWKAELPSPSKQIEPMEFGAARWDYGIIKQSASHKLPAPKTNRQRRQRAKIERTVERVWASLGNWQPIRAIVRNY